MSPMSWSAVVVGSVLFACFVAAKWKSTVNKIHSWTEPSHEKEEFSERGESWRIVAWTALRKYVDDQYEYREITSYSHVHFRDVQIIQQRKVMTPPERTRAEHDKIARDVTFYNVVLKDGTEFNVRFQISSIKSGAWSASSAVELRVDDNYEQPPEVVTKKPLLREVTGSRIHASEEALPEPPQLVKAPPVTSPVATPAPVPMAASSGNGQPH